MAKSTKNTLQKEDKTEHKIISYFIVRKLARLLPLGLAKALTRFLMISKELLDKIGLGTFEREDVRANNKGVEEASEDIIKKRHYRYQVSVDRLLKNLFKYLHLKQ